MKHFLVTRGIEPLRIGIVPLGVDPIPHFSLCEETEESCYRYHRIVHLIEYIPPPKAAPVVVRKVLPPPIVRTANLPSAPSGISLLLPAGKLLVENTLMYLHNSAGGCANLHGQPAASPHACQHPAAEPKLLCRYPVLNYVGITSRLEVEADLPTFTGPWTLW